MLTRRGFAGVGFGALAGRMLPEAAYAQRAAVQGKLPADMAWLNANENPEGPPRSSIEAMTKVLSEGNRYHYQEFGEFYGAIARSEELSPDQILVGSGSSEVLHAAIDAFTSATRPLITVSPTYEGPVDLANRGLGRTVLRVPLEPPYVPDVKKLVEHAEKSGGGLIYLCNPNNPTSSITPKKDLAWLIGNLPANTVALIDEAYCHFAETPDFESALSYVRQGKSVVVTRTFSKIYGMAGLRAGFACASPELIAKMAPFRNNVISIVTVRAVLAALAEQTLLLERRAKLNGRRRELCAWLREHDVPYIEPQANFIMMDVGRDSREFISAMPPRGVAVGRPFPPMTNFLRVSIGSDRDMAKFREVFWSVYKA